MTIPDRIALYFGCLGEKGHYLHLPCGRRTIEPKLDVPGFPWSIGLLDSGLLKNGKHRDIYDGKVWWTCAQRAGGLPWHAFVWWDRSADSHPNSNSGLYVRGFDLGMLVLGNVFEKATIAFEFAQSVYPTVIARQRFPLVLQP